MYVCVCASVNLHVRGHVCLYSVICMYGRGADDSVHFSLCMCVIIHVYGLTDCIVTCVCVLCFCPAARGGEVKWPCSPERFVRATGEKGKKRQSTEDSPISQLAAALHELWGTWLANKPCRPCSL